MIIDASEDGVTIRNLSELYDLKEESYLESLIAFRMDIPAEVKLSIIEKTKNQVGKEYDYDFDVEDNGAFFCSELITYALQDLNLSIPTTTTFFRTMTSPSDMVAYMQGTEAFSPVPFTELFHLDKQKGILVNLTQNLSLK
jgi:hypothetical protein